MGQFFISGASCDKINPDINPSFKDWAKLIKENLIKLGVSQKIVKNLSDDAKCSTVGTIDISLKSILN